MGVFRRRFWPREIWLYVSCLPTTRQMRFSPTPSYRRKGDCPFQRRSTRVSPPPSLSVRPEGTFLSDWITCKNFQCKAGPPARNPSASVRGRLWGLTLRSCIMGGMGIFQLLCLKNVLTRNVCCRMLPGVPGTADWLAVHPPARLPPDWSPTGWLWLSSLWSSPLSSTGGLFWAPSSSHTVHQEAWVLLSCEKSSPQFMEGSLKRKDWSI